MPGSLRHSSSLCNSDRLSYVPDPLGQKEKKTNYGLGIGLAKIGLGTQLGQDSFIAICHKQIKYSF